MQNLADGPDFDANPASLEDQRMTTRFLHYWEALRADTDKAIPLIGDLDLANVGEIAPNTFNLDVAGDPDDPKFRFVGQRLIRDCGGHVANPTVSQLVPQSCLARAVEHRHQVVAEKEPRMIADEFIDEAGDKVLYRGVLLPFSSTGERVDIIIGALASKTVALGATRDRQADRPSDHRAERPSGHPAAPQARKEVSELIADVATAMGEERPDGERPGGAASDGPASQADEETGGGDGGQPRGRIIVIGSEKGGTGKSTTAMHLIVTLLYHGHKVGCIDLDMPQSSLGRYVENRRNLNRMRELDLPLPTQLESSHSTGVTGRLEDDLMRLAETCDYVVVDTPGSNSPISRLAHAWADIVVTPINDSFVDLDTLAVLDAGGKKVRRRGHYAQMVASAREHKIARTGEGFDWIVLRNRLTNLEAKNKNRMADALNILANYLDFRNGPGLSERVIYRELFVHGLTLLDLREQRAGVALSMSHLAARQELRALLQSIGIATPARDQEPRAAAS
jgi:chromosome partitioning protein